MNNLKILIEFEDLQYIFQWFSHVIRVFSHIFWSDYVNIF